MTDLTSMTIADAVVKNAPDTVNDFFLVPKVVE